MVLTKTISFHIEGMTCASCSTRLEKLLRKKEGVLEADVNLALETATIKVDPKLVSMQQLVELVVRAGFSVKKNIFSFDIEGMTCAACSARLEKQLLKQPQIMSAQINLALERAVVHYADDGRGLNFAVMALSKVVSGVGFKAVFPNVGLQKSSKDKTSSGWFPLDDDKAIWVALFFALPLILNMAGHMTGLGTFLPAWLMAVLATPVQFWVGERFYVGGWKALRGGGANMDVLVALGTSAAYFFSLFLVLQKGEGALGHLYFDGGAIIITLILFGKILENKAKQGAAKAITLLMGMRPQSAIVLRDGQEIEIAIDEVLQGDLLVVRPGQMMAVDGIVFEGRSEVDEALITGESLPVLKQKGSEVIGGTLNGNGLLTIQATAVGQDTTLSKIITLVENAQNGKAPVQKLVDQVATIFVPVVVTIALLTFAVWMIWHGDFETALVASISVLVIACPCALGLATPTALVAGTGAAAKAGILIKDIEALERANKISLVIFDKTGTLTQGTPQLTELFAMQGDKQALLAIAAAVQQGSEHPLGKAILTHYQQEGGKALSGISAFQAIIGAGVKGIYQGKDVLSGNAALMQDHAISLDSKVKNKALCWEQEGKTVIYVAYDQQFYGLIALEDKIKDGAKQAVTSLKARGIKTMMVSGDAKAVAQRVAAQIGITAVVAQARPEDKVIVIKEALAKGEHVAMVGDGVNDAPALALADVSIAMGTGSDIALETAGITLMRAEPSLVVSAYDISKATWHKIIQNLFWAFCYNIIGIPLAAMGLLNPAFAGAAMAFSSISVVTNSLLLRRWKP